MNIKQLNNSRAVIHSCQALRSWLYSIMLLFIVSPAFLSAQILLEEGFTGNNAPGWILGNDASLTGGNGDPIGDGWLQLTTATNIQTGYAYLVNSFPSTQGLILEFDFTIWGGSGADGFTVFLYDGANTNFQIGGFGGSLGYAPICGQVGLRDAYVGIAFDEFGNFSNPSECRNGGTQFTPDAVAIRGPGNDSTGYEYLTGTPTLPNSLDIISGTRPDQSGIDYRRARVEITPNGVSYTINVAIQYGQNNPYTQIINDYPLPSAPPPTLKLGFGASTGALNNFHEIRKVTVTVPTDLSMSKSVDNANPVFGDILRYTLKAWNNGPNDATNTVVYDVLPPGLRFVTALMSQGSFSTNQDTIFGNLGLLAEGDTATMTLVVKAEGSGPFQNVAYVESDQNDLNPGDNGDTLDVSVSPSFPTGPTFNCDGTFYVSGQNLSIDLHELDRGNTPFSIDLVDQNSNVSIDAIGIRRQDGYIYASNGSNLVRIDSDGVANDLGLIYRLPAATYSAGAVDADGYLWLYREATSKFYRVDVDFTSSTYREVVDSLTSNAADLEDFVFHPYQANSIYAYSGSNIKHVNMLSGLTTSIPSNQARGDLEAMFIDPAGNLFGYEDGSSTLWKFDITTGDGTAVGSVSNSIDAPIDGCNCAFSVYLEKYVVPTTAEPGDTITYYFGISNASSNTISGLTFTDILPGGFTYVAGTLQNPFGGSANAYAGTSALTITGLSVPAATQQGLISIDVAIPDNENLANNTFTNQALLLNVPSAFGGPQLDSDDPNTGELGDPTPIGIVPPSQGIRGKVFEDMNYGGGEGRDYAAANASAIASGFVADLVAVEGARIELYTAAGTFVSVDTTIVDGSYAFPFLADGSYFVRVVNASVTSNRTSNGTGLNTWAVQTFRTNASTGQAVDVVNEVGGSTPNAEDDLANITAEPITALVAQSVSPVTLNGEYVEQVDFGFNLDVVVNTNDAGQGSLRQFILNSNELANTNLDQEDSPAGVTAVAKEAGTEHSIFMIAASNLVLVTDGGSGTAMNIQPASALSTVTDNNTAIIGETQTAYTGDTNTGAAEVTTGAEVIVDYRASVTGPALSLSGDDFLMSSLGIGRVDGTGIDGAGIQINGSGGTIRNSTVFENGNTGIKMDNTANNLLESNIIRDNAQNNSASDGVQMSNVSITSINNNQIVGNGGYGIDFVIGTNNTISITSNLIKDNGNSSNTEDAGIGLRNGINNTISQNSITGNAGDGIIVRNNQTGNLITQNSIFDNAELGIDLDAGSANQGDGATLNDIDDVDTGGNTLLNFPILEGADLNSANNTITLTGFARPGVTIELFLAAADPTGFGEGQTFLLTLVEGSADDRDVTVDSYGPDAINGILQGADNTDRFDFLIPVPTGVGNGSLLTATATDGSNNTSEFSGLVQVSESGIELSGFVYHDPNHNKTMDGDEAGSGLNLFAKLVEKATPGGPADDVVSVDPATGAYLFSRVNPGDWTIVISLNGNPADVDPMILPDWVGTEAPNHSRAGIVATSSSIANLNFGLYNGSRLTGIVFEDNGTGSGTANNAFQDGAEPGIAKVRVLVEDAGGGTVYDNTSTAANGEFELWMPASIGGTPVQIREANLAGYLSTGGEVGNTGGTYGVTTDLVTLAFAAGTTYGGIEFADVKEHVLAPDNSSHTAPGTVVFYAHSFNATTGGLVTFATSNVSTPADPAYTNALYRDVNCDGNLDSNDVAIVNSVAVSTGDEICLIVKVQVPPNAPNGGQDVVTLTARVDFLNSAPAINRIYSVTDVTTVGDANSGLILDKVSSTSSAAPGDTITYSISYTNFGTEPIGTLLIKDATPSYTTLLDATADTLPDQLSGVTITAPAAGEIGQIRWSFSGQLLPGASGIVRFRVVLD